MEEDLDILDYFVRDYNYIGREIREYEVEALERVLDKIRENNLIEY